MSLTRLLPVLDDPSLLCVVTSELAMEAKGRRGREGGKDGILRAGGGLQAKLADLSPDARGDEMTGSLAKVMAKIATKSALE